jgi:hypothetical protein
MPYRAQVFATFDWRVGYRASSQDDVRMVATGTGTSLADCQTKIQSAITTDQANRTAREASRTVIYENTFPD